MTNDDDSLLDELTRAADAQPGEVGRLLARAAEALETWQSRAVGMFYLVPPDTVIARFPEVAERAALLKRERDEAESLREHIAVTLNEALAKVEAERDALRNEIANESREVTAWRDRCMRAEAERDRISELHADAMHLVERAEAERDEARAERDEANADAARYRWLRENCREHWSGEDAKVEPVQLIHYEPGLEGTEGWRERLDAAIDAHLKGKP